MDKPKRSYAEIRLCASRKVDEKFQQIIYVNYNLEEFIYLLDTMNSVFEETFNIEPSCIFRYKAFSNSFFFNIFLSPPVRMSWNIGDDRKLILMLKSKMGLYHVVLATLKTSTEKKYI